MSYYQLKKIYRVYYFPKTNQHCFSENIKEIDGEIIDKEFIIKYIDNISRYLFINDFKDEKYFEKEDNLYKYHYHLVNIHIQLKKIKKKN